MSDILLLLQLAVGASFIAAKFIEAPLVRVNFTSNETVLSAGATFSLACEGSCPLLWEFPPSMHRDEQVVSFYDAHSMSLVVRLVAVSARHVGIYTCRCNTSTPEDGDGSARSIYVYVDDPAQLIVPTENLLVATQTFPLIIPCKPSAPDVEVTLLQDDDPIVPGLPFQGLDGRVASYDQRIGFTVPDMHSGDSSYLYHCRGRRGDVTNTMIFVMTVFQYVDSLPKPEITDSYSCNGTTVLNCRVQVGLGYPFLLQWTYPNSDLPGNRVKITNWLDRRDCHQTRKIGRTSLTITNSTSQDLGLFKCEILDSNKHSNSDEKYVFESCKTGNFNSEGAGASDIVDSKLFFTENINLPFKDVIFILAIFFLLVVIFKMCYLLSKKDALLERNHCLLDSKTSVLI